MASPHSLRLRFSGTVAGALLVALLAAVAACVPADEALPLGSAQFTVTGRGSPRTLSPGRVVDGWTVHVDRFLLSFRTMTIVNIAESDQCAYRGRGAETNVVFDGTTGSVVQAFNGIKPGNCTDVGMRLGPPDNRTVPGEGATVDDVVALLTGAPAHALLEATATREADPRSKGEDQTLRISLRFDSSRTASSFGGCRDAIRGAKIRAEARDAVFVDVAAEVFFRDSLGGDADLRVGPFEQADSLGNDDGVATMEDLDALPINAVQGLGSIPPSASLLTFGDYVRAQFMFAVRYGDGGLCNGIAPGTELDE